ERGGHDACVPVRRAVHDDVPEAAAAGDRGDRGGGDHEDGGDSHAGEDQWERERELHPPQHLRFRHAHAARGIDDIAVDAVHGEVGIRQHRRDGEHDERDRVVPEADTEDGQAERDEDETRQRAPDIRDAGGGEEPTVQMTEPQPDRKREQERDAERGGCELERLARLHEQQMRMAPDEPERVDERPHAALPSRTHGVSARCASTMSPSATSASATTMPPAAKISVLKTSCWSAVKIGAPRPFATTNDATVAIEIVETVAMRSPARMAGRASGSSTRVNVWKRVKPEPRATSTISAGTPRSPSIMFR